MWYTHNSLCTNWKITFLFFLWLSVQIRWTSKFKLFLVLKLNMNSTQQRTQEPQKRSEIQADIEQDATHGEFRLKQLPYCELLESAQFMASRKELFLDAINWCTHFSMWNQHPLKIHSDWLQDLEFYNFVSLVTDSGWYKSKSLDNLPVSHNNACVFILFNLNLSDYSFVVYLTNQSLWYC